MHKVSQHMQNTIAQHQQRREKVTWNPQLHCALSSSKIPRQSGDARNRRARACQLFSGRVPLFTRKNTMFRADPNIQIASMMQQFQLRSANSDLQNTIRIGSQYILENNYPSRSLGAAIPLRSAQTELHNSIDLQHTTLQHITLMHQFQFHCTKCLKACKTQ